MSQPTPLSPWYVVVQMRESHPVMGGTVSIEYYQSPNDSERESDVWTQFPKKAMLFMSVSTASRVAELLGADILVIWDKEKAQEYRE